MAAQRAAHPSHDHRRLQPGSGHITDHHAQLPGGQGEHVIPVTAHGAFAGDVADGHLRTFDNRQREGKQAALQRLCRDPVLLRHQRVHRGGRPVRGQLQQLHVVVGELTWGQRADVQHADHPAASDQRYAYQGADPLRQQDRVQHGGVVNTIEDHRLVPGGDPPSEPPADRDPHALAHLLLQPGRRRGDQLPRGEVQQQHRGGVGSEDRPGALEQLREQLTIIKPGQGGIGDGLDVAEPVLRPGAAHRRRDLDAARPPGHRTGHGRLHPGWKGAFQRRISTVVCPRRCHWSRIARSWPAVVVSISAGAVTTGTPPAIWQKYLVTGIDAHLPPGTRAASGSRISTR